ncbi:hypothetical protein DPMN_131125 [Dreissena polymorpha]|uniref:Uncharacterized protein n=1 Tax=Dreissena polymorpha TaxID=45954 RepID=A0A9D4H6D6_DREPO|nr:hypothetical protein DPMN_131125 [Dreissena polymorpha]
MSRYPHERIKDRNSEEVIKIDDLTVKAICGSTDKPPYIETITCNVNIVEATDVPGQPMAQVEMRQIKTAQRNDWLIERWRRAVIDKVLPNIHHITQKRTNV